MDYKITRYSKIIATILLSVITIIIALFEAAVRVLVIAFAMVPYLFISENSKYVKNFFNPLNESIYTNTKIPYIICMYFIFNLLSDSEKKKCINYIKSITAKQPQVGNPINLIMQRHLPHGHPID